MSAPPPYNYPPPDQQGYPPPDQGQGYPPPQQQQQPYPDKAAYPAQPPANYPPQAGYPAQPPPAQQQSTVNTTVITTQPTVITRPSFRTYPVVVTLADGRQVQTRLDFRSGILTWLICCALFWVLCGLTGFLGPIGLVAFCINDTKDVYHLDPEGNVVGVYKRI